MWIFVVIGFRNLLRNKRRSFLTSLIIGMGLAAMIITDGFIIGMNENMVHLITNSLITEGQIHNPLFKSSMKPEYQILKIDQVRNILNKDNLIDAYAERVISFGMLSSPKNMKNVSIYGIQGDREAIITSLNKQIINGDFVNNENSLVIGDLLRKQLAIEVGDKVILTTSKLKSGDISQELFRVSGVFKAGSRDLDEKTVFISISKAQSLLGVTSGDVNEIGLKFKDRKKVESMDYPLWGQLDKTGNKAEPWNKIASDFSSVMKMTNQSKALIGTILLFLVALGIINTLFMAMYERMFEFGVLKALGTKKREIILMIVSEAVALAILGVVVGALISIIIGGYLSSVGIDYGGVEFANVTFREPIYFIFELNQFTEFPVLIIFFTFLVGLYPAIHASKIGVAQAVKKAL